MATPTDKSSAPVPETGAPSKTPFRLPAGPPAWITPALLCALSLVFLYRSAYNAGALEVVSDSVEYAITSLRLATLGRYDIPLNGHVYPARYPPWFCAIVLAPVYRMFPHDIGNGIYAILAFAVLGVFLAYLIGARLGGPWAGAGAALVLMSAKDYWMLARIIMTDVPAAVLGLIGCLLYLEMRGAATVRRYACAGLLCALATAFRYDMAGLYLPFIVLALRDKGRRGSSLVLVLFPGALLVLATAIYNAHVFGDWSRDGYHFWAADPYDYPSMVWSLSYVTRNVLDLLAKRTILEAALGVAGAMILWRKRNPELAPIVAFAALACVPSGIAHLLYAWPGVRFHLLGVSLACILGGAGLMSLLTERARHHTWALPLILLPGFLLFPYVQSRLTLNPRRRVVAETISRLTPRNAVVVSAIDPVYLSWWLDRDADRTVIPLSRSVPYANMVIVRHRIPHPNPLPILWHPRSPGMFRGGAQDFIPFTADERPGALLAYLRRGRPVYLDISFATSPGLPPWARAQFLAAPLPGSPWLLRLEARAGAPRKPGRLMLAPE